MAMLFAFVTLVAAATATPAMAGETTLSRTDVVLQVGGFGCASSAEGLPLPTEGWRPLLLGTCALSNDSAATLKDGVLYLGSQRSAMIVPARLPDGPRCFEGGRTSRMREYHLGACLFEEETEEGRTDMSVTVKDGRVVKSLVVYYSLMEPSPRPGHTLSVVPIKANETPEPVWEYLPKQRLLRVIGTNVCMTPPAGDLTYGAPLYLDVCGAPEAGFDPSKRADGPTRQVVKPR